VALLKLMVDKLKLQLATAREQFGAPASSLTTPRKALRRRNH
jgi:hypothetical protein